MKRLLLAVVPFLLSAGCGLYTNVPAQVSVVEIKPASVTYDLPNAAGQREAKFEQAQVTVRGEPGSIGVTFTDMKIDYLEANGTKTTNPPTLQLGGSYRVDSSNYPTAVGANPVPVAQVGQQTTSGAGTFILPVVNRYVEGYGSPTSQNLSGVLTARVELRGTDDAGYPATLLVYVPITFHGR